MTQKGRIEQWRAPARTTPENRVLLCWRDEWQLGVPSMDEDHRALASALNAAATALQHPPHPRKRAFARKIAYESLRRRPRAEPRIPELADGVAPELCALWNQTRSHFAREEALMHAADYPWLAEHKAEHAILLAELTVTLRELARAPVSGADTEALVGLKHWFLGHLLDMDKRLARYLQQTGITNVH